MVKADRSLIIYILLNLVTAGIYSLFFYHKLAKDVNILCAGDGDITPGLLKYILLSLITCGIYGWIWHYKLANRLQLNAVRYSLTFNENGTTVLLWMILGALLCGIGPFFALHIIMKNTNAMANAYNRYQMSFQG